MLSYPGSQFCLAYTKLFDSVFNYFSNALHFCKYSNT